MAGTFDAGLATAVDRARLALGDVAKPFLLQDETYSAVLFLDPASQPPTEAPMTAAYVRLARSLSSVCANKAVLVKQGTTQRQWLDRAAHYKEPADGWAASGVPEDPSFTTAGGAPLVGRLNGPDGCLLDHATGLSLSLHPLDPRRLL